MAFKIDVYLLPRQLYMSCCDFSVPGDCSQMSSPLQLTRVLAASLWGPT